MACNDRQLTQAQREAAYQQQRTGVARAVRPFGGSPTIENLIDYVNRELGPAVRASRDAINECFLQVADNAPSANPLAFYFSTSVAAADPTVGRIRLNASPQNTATIMRVSQSNARLVDVQPWLDVMAGGPTTPLGVVTLVDAINPGRFIRWDLNTMTDQGAYWDLGITVIESSDADPFVEDEAVVVGFISGVSAAGSTVPVGSLSPIARDTFLGNIGTTTAPPAAVPLASVDSTSIAYDGTAHEFQRAALTGFATASANSNATASAEPIVTYSASANMSAERVLTTSTSNTISTAVANQIAVESTAITGAIAIAANATASLFAGIRDNGSAETDRTNLNFVSGDSNTAVVTDDAGNDELEVTYNYVGSTTNVNLTSLTGDQNVVDISTLRCGGSVTVETVSANYSIDGFTAKTDGFWFWFIDRRTSGTAIGKFLEDIGATTTSIRNEEEIETVIPVAGRALLYYINTRWRVQAPGSTRGRLISRVRNVSADSSYSITPPAGATWFHARFVGAGGGGGGADADTDEACAGGGGAAGATEDIIVEIVSGNITGVIGAAGTAGSNVGGLGGTGADTTVIYDGVTYTATGGDGGAGMSTGAGDTTIPVVLADGGTGGVHSTALGYDGGDGGEGWAYGPLEGADTKAAIGGLGGASSFGGGGRGGAQFNVSGAANGAAGKAPGSGGGGGARIAESATTGATGGAGKAGALIIEFHAGPVPSEATIS